jgi:dihydrofolate synthase/folylpolyglutamate synthase
VRSSPTVIADAAHNAAGMLATVAALDDAFAFTSLVGVVACLADKDARAMLEVLEPALTSLVVTTNSSPRALSADALFEVAVDVFGEERVSVEDRLDDALDAAIQQADEAGTYGGAGVLVTGSVVTAAEARRLLNTR